MILKKTVKKIWPYVKNKYLLAFIFFAIWLIFFDQNNLIDRVVAVRKYHQMQQDKLYYQDKIKIDNRKLEELRTDRENLEKFAREQYLMKRDNEDIFIVKDE
jgi:cell division protein DivIC